jgi:hypothetical protein
MQGLIATADPVRIEPGHRGTPLLSFRVMPGKDAGISPTRGPGATCGTAPQLRRMEPGRQAGNRADRRLEERLPSAAPQAARNAAD